MSLANPLPSIAPFKGLLWYFHAPGIWERLGEITVSPAGIQNWHAAANNQGVGTSWEDGIQTGWSYVFPAGTGPNDFLFLID